SVMRPDDVSVTHPDDVGLQNSGATEFMANSLIERLERRDYESSLTVFQIVFYSLERTICHAVLRRSPPMMDGPQLLNLGCGPHNYPGWVNADDYAPKRRLRERSFRPNWNLDVTRVWK